MKSLLAGVCFVSAICSANQIRIIDGSPAQPANYPEVVRLRIIAGGASVGCTGTVVGPKAILTASHCIDGVHYTGGSASVSIKVNQVPHDALGVRLSANGGRDDVGLLITKKPLKLRAASVADLGAGAALGQVGNVAGFGCAVQGGNESTPNEALIEGETVVTQLSGNQIITKDAALCFGDSGAPLFALPAGKRRVLWGLGVSGNIKDVSYFADLQNEAVRDELVQLATQHRIKICGLTAACK